MHNQACPHLQLALLRPVRDAAPQLQAVRRPEQRQQVSQKCQCSRLGCISSSATQLLARAQAWRERYIRGILIITSARASKRAGRTAFTGRQVPDSMMHDQRIHGREAPESAPCRAQPSCWQPCPLRCPRLPAAARSTCMAAAHRWRRRSDWATAIQAELQVEHVLVKQV